MGRKRPSICITINDALLTDIDETAKKLGMTRSDVIERAVLLGLPKLKGKFEKKETEVTEEGHELSKAYLRKVIFDVENADMYGWQPTGY